MQPIYVLPKQSIGPKELGNWIKHCDAATVSAVGGWASGGRRVMHTDPLQQACPSYREDYYFVIVILAIKEHRR